MHFFPFFFFNSVESVLLITSALTLFKNWHIIPTKLPHASLESKSTTKNTNYRVYIFVCVCFNHCFLICKMNAHFFFWCSLMCCLCHFFGLCLLVCSAPPDFTWSLVSSCCSLSSLVSGLYTFPPAFLLLSLWLLCLSFLAGCFTLPLSVTPACFQRNDFLGSASYGLLGSKSNL